MHGSAAAPRRGQQPRRYRNLRGDLTVARAEEIMEATFGLPAGAVSLRLPDGRDARGDKKVSRLRADYDSTSPRQYTRRS